MNTPHEPLKPAPRWEHTTGAGWQSPGLTSTLRDHAPFAYTKGFEDGAYALAAVLYPLAWSLDDAKRQEAMMILRRYHDGLAHPVAGWQHEPPRS